jgi:hypothetical protein
MKRLQPTMLFPLRAPACDAIIKDINTAYTSRVFPERVSGAIGKIIICRQPTVSSTDDMEFPDCSGVCGVHHN